MTGRHHHKASVARGGSGNVNDGHHHNHHHQCRHQRRDRSNSHHRKPQSKSDLWRGSLDKDIGNDVIVQMVGMDSPGHTVYARVDPNRSASPAALAATPVGRVVEVMVAEGWRHVARSILEGGGHVEAGETHPPAAELLRLGAVWLLNETDYAASGDAHARRLSRADEADAPDWSDMTLRVHYVPDRFFAAHEVDWGKYCRGLLLDGCTSAVIGGRRAHVPVTGMPDGKDGVIVYEDNDLGIAILNKPGGMPIYHTKSNNTEDVSAMFGASLKGRLEAKSETPFLSLPVRMGPEMQGLLLAATKKDFCSYMAKQLAPAADDHDNGNEDHADPTGGGMSKTYRCLVCIRDPDDIDRIEGMVNRTIRHYVSVKSPTPKLFHNKPKPGGHEWAECLMRITSVAGRSARYRAACVSSKYDDPNDSALACRLWGPDRDRPAEDLGVRYVMELECQLLNARERPHQIRGQLAALGVPVVGDEAYGGGRCEMRGHRHMWMRMAAQVCRLEFRMPRWEDGEEGGRTLVPSEEKGVFNLNTAWWSEYLVDYEQNFEMGLGTAR